MILYFDRYKDDRIVLACIDYLLNLPDKQFGDRVECLENRITKEPTDESIAICGHGNIGHIGYQGAESLAAYLSGFSGPVTLFSCHSAIGNPSLAESLHTFLDVPVTARKGSMLTARYIGERVVLAEHDREYYADVQNRILMKYGFATQGENGWIINGSVSKIWTDLPADIIEKSHVVGERTKDLYNELVNVATDKGYLYPEGEGILTIL